MRWGGMIYRYVLRVSTLEQKYCAGICLIEMVFLRSVKMVLIIIIKLVMNKC